MDGWARTNQLVSFLSPAAMSGRTRERENSKVSFVRSSSPTTAPSQINARQCFSSKVVDFTYSHLSQGVHGSGEPGAYKNPSLLELLLSRLTTAVDTL